MERLVIEARVLCQSLQHILYRMDLPDVSFNAYNDKWRDRIEHILHRALRRYERRMRLWLME